MTPVLDYEQFVAKFRPVKTTDDCYTPAPVFDAVKDWVFAEAALPPSTPVIRPFWPGGDYESEEYPPGSVVIDNPPFSSLSKIVATYLGAGIRFFLFAPGLACFGLARFSELTLVAGTQIRYENGARVFTAFATNLFAGKWRFISSPSLVDAIAIASGSEKKQKPPRTAYDVPAPVFAARDLARLGRRGVEWRLPASSAVFVRNLDGLAARGKSVFGNGAFLVSARSRAELAAAEKAAAEKNAEQRKSAEKIEIALSSVERAIVARLDSESPPPDSAAMSA